MAHVSGTHGRQSLCGQQTRGRGVDLLCGGSPQARRETRNGRRISRVRADSMPIHSTAILDASSRVPDSCNIGPYCIIGPNVELGENCRLVSHVHIEGPTRIGNNVGVFPFTSLGMAPQDIGYAGEPTRLEIGDDNEIREFVTINRGTVKGGGVTRVGNHILVMAYA